jgi:hypothetical protein
MINHMIFSRAVPTPESGEDGAFKELVPEATDLRQTIKSELRGSFAPEPIN